MTTDEKLIAIQQSPEMKKAIALLIALYTECELKSFIRLTYNVNGMNYELTFLPISHQVTITSLTNGQERKDEAG